MPQLQVKYKQQQGIWQCDKQDDTSGWGWSKRIDVYILPVRQMNPERMDPA